MKTCDRCGQRPCVCVQGLGPNHVWIIQDCSRPGCTVVIRSRAGQQPAIPICKWCAGAAATSGVEA